MTPRCRRRTLPTDEDRRRVCRDDIARTGRFLTFCAGAATIGARLHEDPRERAALRVVRETGAGLVLRGKVGMHTSPVYAEEVYIGSHSGIDRDGHRATFVVAVNAPGVTVVCRKMSALNLDMPAVDLEHLRAVAMPQRRPVTPPPGPSPSAGAS